MKKLLLVDGNSILFRAYHATAYGRMIKTSNGVPTNAINGFVLMLNKAISMIEPDYILIAWDSGKPTFRHEYYDEYKGTRSKLAEELIVQFPMVREYQDAYGLPRYECEGIEADDIIGSTAKQFRNVETFILSSDQDLLQLIDEETKVCLMKKGISEMVIVDEAQLKEMKGITPAQVIELKGLMGDSADNIPGVPGVGEKTALKLLDDYGTVENVYEHIDEIKGKLKEKLQENYDKAILSKYLATIVIDAELPFTMEELRYQEPKEELTDFFIKYEMNSFISKKEEVEHVEKQKMKMVEVMPKSFYEDEITLFLDIDNEGNYDATLYGIAFAYQQDMVYITTENLQKDKEFIKFLSTLKTWMAYDAKSVYHAFSRYDIKIGQCAFDYMVAVFLVDSAITTYEKLLEKYHAPFSDNKDAVYGKKGKPSMALEDERLAYVNQHLSLLLTFYDNLNQKIDELDLRVLFDEVELPLTKVLYKMEQVGVTTSREQLNVIAKNTQEKISELSNQIYDEAGHEFNINSPKQLGTVLFDELGLKSGKKRSTAVDVLEKLAKQHPIAALLMEQRKYQKIYSTYAVGLEKHIMKDEKIHTTFNQCLAQTGRLSSSEPNLQNISVRDKEGKEIRKAFTASEGNMLLSADYSQIELRMLAHMSKEEKMLDAFKHEMDIHTKTAMDIFGVSQKDVTGDMRRQAKTVNFGIVYGQSDFGLSEQLGITRGEAHGFIEKYFETYPKIKTFMDETIAFCEEHGYVTTIFHRRREIPEIHAKEYMMREFGKRAAMNAPIQGSAADLIKMAMIKIDQRMKKEKVKSKMILQIHDELIFDVIEDELELMKEIVEDGMEKVVKLDVPLLADHNIGFSWYDAK